ncbi:MAG: hypothetical protein JRN39_03705 [Nitrososphaerota archaeon]|nr:hypothetical protein [Nitrososphaerota archaeon]MDG6939489.1 hypothetical protein [Nitrososphaerota archaeon]
MKVEDGLGVGIRRDAPVKLYPFLDYFRGFEDNPAVREIFGDGAGTVLGGLKVEFFSSPFGYMGTSDQDGHLLVSTHHLKTGDFKTLYLDVIHELCHVKQHMDGRPLFSQEYEYVDNPTEVEAYLSTVKEARRIGLTDAEIIEYLKVEWISREQHGRLVERMGIRLPHPTGTDRTTSR